MIYELICDGYRLGVFPTEAEAVRRADYLPVIAWGQLAVQAARLQVGDTLSLEGRVQSRTYRKVLEDGTAQERVAYEVSAMHLLEPEAAE